MPIDPMLVPPGDALDQLARKLLVEVRLQNPKTLVGKPIDGFGDDVGTNLLAWLFDAFDDALGNDDGD
ncbi:MULTISPECIES: hypothetical protein [unclassified Methylobacterium]|uniref:hypothetical protein n=1 Tax=unclassified Methylobacterium TaxID=2615210 RepID=UPI0011C1E6CC|nr:MULTISPECIES: hypothetical protein [unclassified Methylobacterium]QEE38964.1 hypothetical protein FVA80_08380 [Methylobacterium sp. WL1]TXN53977.1 hypothetical protein FV241_25985 [Methylobacterium sp. WL2]